MNSKLTIVDYILQLEKNILKAEIEKYKNVKKRNQIRIIFIFNPIFINK